MSASYIDQIDPYASYVIDPRRAAARLESREALLHAECQKLAEKEKGGNIWLKVLGFIVLLFLLWWLLSSLWNKKNTSTSGTNNMKYGQYTSGQQRSPTSSSSGYGQYQQQQQQQPSSNKYGQWQSSSRSVGRNNPNADLYSSNSVGNILNQADQYSRQQGLMGNLYDGGARGAVMSRQGAGSPADVSYTQFSYEGGSQPQPLSLRGGGSGY